MFGITFCRVALLSISDNSGDGEESKKEEKKLGKEEKEKKKRRREEEDEESIQCLQLIPIDLLTGRRMTQEV